MNRSVIAWMGTIVLAAIAASPTCPAGAESVGQAPAIGTQQIEADWLRQDEVRGVTAAGRPAVHMTPEEDAAGALDGDQERQVGLPYGRRREPLVAGRPGPADAPGADRALQPLRHRRSGRADHGPAVRRRQAVPAGLPARRHGLLRLHRQKAAGGEACTGRRARYVRLQLPGKSYFHLDEVEIYARRRSAEHRPCGKPATQSSVSEWSPAARRGARRPEARPGLRHGPRHRARAETGRGAAATEGRRRRARRTERCGRRPSGCGNCRPRPPTKSAAGSTSKSAGPCGGWRWAIRSWISTRSCSSSGPRASCRTCPTSTTAGGRGRAAGSACWRASRRTAPAFAASRRHAARAASCSPDLSYDGKRLLFAYCR